MSNLWRVEVVDAETGEVVKVFETTNERSANRIDDGLSINLDHKQFYTRIWPPDGEEGIEAKAQSK